MDLLHASRKVGKYIFLKGPDLLPATGLAAAQTDVKEILQPGMTSGRGPDTDRRGARGSGSVTSNTVFPLIPFVGFLIGELPRLHSSRDDERQNDSIWPVIALFSALVKLP